MKVRNQFTCVAVVVLTVFLGGCKGETLKDKTSYGFNQVVEFTSSVGSKIGDKLGFNLKDEDEAEVEKTTADALDNAKDGETVAWSNAAGLNAKITTNNSRKVKRTMKIARVKGVQLPPELDLIGKPYRIHVRSAKVRSSWTTNSQWLRSVAQDNIVTVVGQVRGTNWLMVSKANRAIGYVRNDLLSPATEINIAHAKQKAAAYQAQKSQVAIKDNEKIETAYADIGQIATENEESPAIPEGFDLDAVEIEKAGLRESDAVDLDAMFANDEEVVVEEISANSDCRDMTAEVVAGENESSRQTFTVCKAADGAWEL